MMRCAAVLNTVTLLTVAIMSTHAQTNQELIDRVAAREIEEAKASWWGFDAEDSTEALQAAINSGVPRLIVDNVGGPWIVRPMSLVSNQEIVFEEGVEVVARRGEFQRTGDSLFTASLKENITLTGYGATLRMHREDYDNPDLYTRGEWRMALSIRSCSNVKIYGLTLAESGGDGIYLGSARDGVTNRDIHIKDVICESNYRQGISVITAENLLIENTTMRNTDGTGPAAGIDFEPNKPSERLVNVVVRDCLTENNTGGGYFLYLASLTAESEPISIRFENCRSVGDRAPGISVVTGNPPHRAVRGIIEFVDCTVESSEDAGISVANKPPGGCEVSFVNCTVINPALERPFLTPIQIRSRPGSSAAVGGVEFVDTRIEDALDRNPLSYIDAGGGIPVEQIGGSLIVARNGEEIRVDLTEELLSEWVTVTDMEAIPRLDLQDAECRPLVEQIPESGYSFVHAHLRRQGRFALHANEGEEVRFSVHHRRLGPRPGETIPIVVKAPSGEEAHRGEAPFDAETDVAFTAPESGIYRMTADPDRHTISVTRSSHPVNLIGEGRRIELALSAGDYHFWVPEGTTRFGVRVGGDDWGRAIRATLIDPGGNVVEDRDGLVAPHQFDIELARPSEGEAWILLLSPPAHGPWQNHSVDLRGLPPLLAPSHGALMQAPFREFEVIEEQELGEALPATWGEWRFRRDPDNVGDEQQWYSAMPEDGDWTEVKVPAFLALTEVGSYLGYGWYSTAFTVAQEYRDRRLLLHFAAVDEQAWVYLNGQHVGEHTEESEGLGVGELWDRPFTIALEPSAVRFGEENHLMVRTHASEGMSGIWGDVTVYLPPAD